MTPTPVKTRERILARYDSGKYTRAQVALHFTVSESLVKKLLKQRKKLGHVELLYSASGRKPSVRPEHEELMRNTLQDNPGTTLEEFRELLGCMCSIMSIHRALKRMRISYKKKRCALPSKTARTCARRAKSGSHAGRSLF